MIRLKPPRKGSDVLTKRHASAIKLSTSCGNICSNMRKSNTSVPQLPLRKSLLCKGGYVGTPTSDVTISDITISGLTGSATNLYDDLVNPSVVSNWKWSGINVQATSKGSCKGQPSGVTCA
ncbi:hypothetical protein LEN26_018769 [Aphanomyces euteiches]|nr:hypothetical protein LEN26_018769 [Aphanomyces euteiches]